MTRLQGYPWALTRVKTHFGFCLRPGWAFAVKEGQVDRGGAPDIPDAHVSR